MTWTQGDVFIKGVSCFLFQHETTFIFHNGHTVPAAPDSDRLCDMDTQRKRLQGWHSFPCLHRTGHHPYIPETGRPGQIQNILHSHWFNKQECWCQRNQAYWPSGRDQHHIRSNGEPWHGKPQLFRRNQCRLFFTVVTVWNHSHWQRNIWQRTKFGMVFVRNERKPVADDWKRRVVG